MPETTPPAAGAHHDAPWAVLIIGAGFGGLAMAIALRRAGERDVLLLEKSNDVGGVWRENTYPGAACDVPSHLYSFSFEPNPRWSRSFSPQPEILDYLRHCASKYGVREQIRFGCTVTGAAFDEGAALWRVQWHDARGDAHEACARTLVSAVGLLSRPVLPALEGRADFAGPAFHSAQWRHDVALAGKRVAVIGTGASAIQFVPQLAREATQLTVFQRTPSWILPRGDRAYTAAEQGRFERRPWLMAWHRAALYLAHDARAIGFTRAKWLLDTIGAWPARRLLRTQVADPALRERLTPKYTIGCKRVLVSDDWLPTFARANVELVTEAIARITPTGVRVAGGREIEADAIVLGTGFAASEFLAPMEIRGRGGRSLNDAWSQGARAWLGIAVPGFPNFFMLYGPNTNLGHNSIVFMLECQVAHVMRCLRKRGAAPAATIEVDEAPFGRYNVRVQQRSRQTVFAGCASWYTDAQGRHTVNWPGFTTTYRWLTRHGSLAVYTVLPAAVR
ncbi:MAG: NAD(P)/FAD-dependent oxidoreductase [Betaproteobacteria bacterium]